MIKNLLLVTALLITALPIMANDINMTPQNTFSGYNNNSARKQYPRIYRATTTSTPITQQEDFMKPKSVREMGDLTPTKDSPMTYGQFPQNYDSSNMMLMQGVQNGMQNMFMGF